MEDFTKNMNLVLHLDIKNKQSKMKRILTILTIIPLLASAQSKKANDTKPPLIESITSDTVNGTFIQVLFSYDESSRVIGIDYKNVSMINDSTQSVKQMETFSKKQTFKYLDISNLPFERTTSFYDYNRKSREWNIGSIKKTYFLYKNGKRYGDSSLAIDNNDKKKDFKWDENNKGTYKVSKLEQTNNRIYRVNDYTNPSTNYPDVYVSEFKLNSFSNVSQDIYEHRYGGRGRSGDYFTFQKYDAMLNPLKQLNISSTLCDEKISVDLSDENGSIDNPDIILSVDWYFINKNNMLDYFQTFNEETAPFKHRYSLKYIYNQYNLPTYVQMLIKRERLEARPIPNPKDVLLLDKYQKSFTFRYKQPS